MYTCQLVKPQRSRDSALTDQSSLGAQGDPAQYGVRVSIGVWSVCCTNILINLQDNLLWSVCFTTILINLQDRSPVPFFKNDLPPLDFLKKLLPYKIDF